MNFSKISELLYPRHCPFCDRLLADDEPYICRDCASSVKLIRGPVCLKCGRPLEKDSAEYCDGCRRKKHLFTEGFAPFAYRGEVQQSIRRFKYGGRAEYGKFYAHMIAVSGRTRLLRWKPEMIAAVPVHPSRYLARGYNQADVLARELSGILQIPTAEKYLYRKKKTRPQKGLTPSERKKNLSGAFGVEDGFVFPKRVLLVDDIYTTGTTLDALAGTVLENGAERVYFACASIAPGQT